MMLRLGWSVFLGLVASLVACVSATISTPAEDIETRALDARNRLEAGRYAEAIPLLQALVDDLRQDLGGEDPEIARGLNLLGFALYRSGQASEALSHHEEALRIFRLELEEATPEVANTYSHLGAARLLAGQPSAAEPYLRKALELSIAAVGEEHEDSASALNNLGYVLMVTGRAREARGFFDRALAVYDRVLGAEHPRSASTRDNLAELLEDAGEYEASLAAYRETLKIQQSSLPDKHPLVARSHGNVARILVAMADYRTAREHYELALDIAESSGHHDQTRYLGGLGSIESSLGRYQEACDYYRRRNAINLEALGADHPDTLASQNDLATMLQELGEYSEAEALYRRTLETYRRIFGAESERVAGALSDLATVLESRGDLPAARALLEQALNLREQRYGDHPKTAIALTNLGHVLKELGDLVPAEQSYRRALRIRQAVLGPDHPKTAASHNNLGAVLEARGDLSGARQHYGKALEIRRRILPASHPDIAISLNNLGLILGPLGEYSEAEAHLREAYRIRLAVYGPDHPAVATSLENLALPARLFGDLDEELDLLRQALRIRQRSLGPDHLDTATSHTNLAYTLLRSRTFSGAKEHFEQALAIRESALRPDHPDVANILDGLGIIAEVEGDSASAVSLVRRALEIRERWFQAPLEMGDDRAKRALMGKSRAAMEYAISLHVKKGSQVPAAAEMAMTAILRQKGRALEASVAERRALGRMADPEVTALREKIRALRGTEIQEVLRPESPEDEAGGQNLAAVRAEIRRLETQLAALLSAARSRRSVDVSAVRAALPAKTALIEYVAFESFDADRVSDPWGATHYAAYWLSSAGAIRAVDLGPAERIDRAVGVFLDTLESGHPGVAERSRELYEELLGPFADALGEVDSLRIAPDGELSLVPFSALMSPEGRYLLEDSVVSYVTSGRVLLGPGAEEEVPREPPLLIGGPAFGAIPERAPRDGESSVADYLPRSVDPLPGAEQEVEDIGRLYGISPDRLLTGPSATESALKSARGPAVLHLATHGFFLADLPPSTFRGWPEPSALRSRDLPSWDGYRAVIALAGYNQRHRASDADDGVLTALEMVDVDLVGTEIVVLSACRTGVGGARYGQGVFGMRRALALAGARSQLSTLWSVDDEATRSLMVDWYQGLARGLDRAAALRQAQLRMIKPEQEPENRGAKAEQARRGGCLIGSRCEGERAHPRYWAAFVLSGEIGPIDLVMPDGP